MIDLHTYPFIIKEAVGEDKALQKSIREVFGLVSGLQPLETFMLQMDAAGIGKSVLLPIDCTTARGCKLFSNEQISRLCKESGRFIGFASVDPYSGSAADDLRRAVEDLGLKGLNLSPGLQEFYPNDKKMSKLYETASILGIPVIFFTGLNMARGAKIKYSLPLLVEDAACGFPELNIVLSHLGWPWILDTVAMLLKYPNVYADTAGHILDTPKEFVEFELSKQITTSAIERSLRGKIIFGSDYPRLPIKKMADSVRALGLSGECLELIFKGNAEKILIH